MMARIQTGFTLIETAATLAVISLIAVSLVGVSSYLVTKQQIETSDENLYQLRRAISGNPVIVINEARTSFGYLGDMGKLPANLDDLWVKGSQPSFTFDTTKKAGAGWNGPYLDVGIIQQAPGLLQDGWGNMLSYSPSTTFDPVFGATSLALVSSLGSDFTLGTGDDIGIRFFHSDVFSRVQGYVKDTNGDTVSGVGLTLNYPVNGVLSERLVYTDSTGYYAASDIPFGNRSITIQPMLVLAPGTVTVSGAASEDLKFTVKNYAAADLGVASLTLKYSISPSSKFSQVLVGGTTVYNNTNPRFGAADPLEPPNGIIETVTFASKTVKGTGVSEESIPIRLQSAVTDVADLVVGKVGKGGSLVIEFRNFYDEVDGQDIDVLGVNFEITLKNSSGDVVGVIAVTP